MTALSKPRFVVGKDCDAWCTKCRMDLAHTVVAIVDELPVKVKCNTCGGIHRYRPTEQERQQEADRKKAARATRSSSPKTSSSRTTTKKATAYHQLYQMADLDTKRKYNIRESFDEGDILEHVTFGIGFITDVVANESGPQKLTVLFSDSERTLIARRT